MNLVRKRVSGLPAIGLLTLVYFIAGKFGLMLASLQASASPVWPPAGIALAALLLLGYRAWPAIFVGAFLVNVTTAGNVATSLAVASGNTLEAVCGAWLVTRFAGGTTVFDRPQGVFKFALAAMVSTIISPAFGVTSLALAGFADWTNYGAIWLTWWLGDTTGDLLIAPLIILWGIPSKRRWNWREAVEVGILVLLLFVLSEAVFGGWLIISAKNYPIAFICGAIVIWTAFRFTQRETATGIFILSAIAIWGTVHGFGPFAGETENQSLLALQSWTAVLTITAMALSAGMAERRRAEEALRESEVRINLAANAANLGLWVWNIRDNELWVTEKWRKLFGFAESEPVNFGQMAQRVHPEDRERMKQRVQHMLEHGGVDRESEYRIMQPDGSSRWIAGYGGVELDEHGKPACARGVSRDITERKIAEEELEQLRQQRTALLEREVAERARLEREVIDICAREQRRIAYDLHDSVGQQLVGIALCAKLLEEQLRGERHSEADKAGMIVKLVNDAARQARLTARSLEGADGVGDLKMALQSLAISMSRDCSVKATVTAEGSSLPISPPVAAQLYRIVQEAVHNAVEHGAARDVQINLAFNHEVLVLTIRDNGKGFDSNANGNGMGLRIMRYRSQCVGGSCDVQSSSEGTVVRCRVPLEPQLAAFGLP